MIPVDELLDVCALLADLAKKIGEEDGTSYAEELEKFLKREPCWTGASAYLKFLRTVSVAPTKGGSTIAEASDVFTVSLNEKFKELGADNAESDTMQAQAQVFQVRRRDKIQDIFASLGDHGWWQQGQIVELCRANRIEQRTLSTTGTFFPFKVEGEEYVADVHMDCGWIGASPHLLGTDISVYPSRHHDYYVVVPQQVTVTLT